MQICSNKYYWEVLAVQPLAISNNISLGFYSFSVFTVRKQVNEKKEEIYLCNNVKNNLKGIIFHVFFYGFASNTGNRYRAS